jgi:hypothetical protein
MGSLLALLLAVRIWSDAPPVVTVGVDPAFWDVAVQGGDAWNLAVDFAYVEGCGNGTLNVCWGDPAIYQPGWVSGYLPDEHLIMVWIPALFFPATACHEFGHALGLWYERSDGLSCMTQHLPQVATPDDQDLAALGVEVIWPTHDGTGGPSWK